MEEGVTQLHPVALLFTIVAGCLILILPRRYSFIPLLFAAVLMPLNQRIVVAGLDLFVIRILLVVAWVRLLARSEYAGVELNRLDRLLILWVILSVVSYTLLWRTPEALINRLGRSVDVLGTYLFMRCAVRDMDDVYTAIRAFATMAVVMAIAMSVEKITGRNYFFVFGGVPEFTYLRDGELRAQGAFAHAITAGSFGAALFPIFAMPVLLRLRGALLMLLGAISSLAITLFCASSGPVIAFAAGIMAMALWYFRTQMKKVLIAGAISLVALQIAMTAPIWALPMKLKVFGASTAYHRYHLVDQFIKRFDEWWLVGVKSTSGWGYYLFDVTNNFVRVGVDGGIITLGVYVWMIIEAFKAAHHGALAHESELARMLCWALGASLFVHTINFMGVSYFDQIKFMLFSLIALISTVSIAAAAEAKEQKGQEAAA